MSFYGLLKRLTVKRRVFFGSLVNHPDDQLNGEKKVDLVFAGTMNYWTNTNTNANSWLAIDMKSGLLVERPSIRFCVVDRKPTEEALALVTSTMMARGSVPDVRPCLQQAVPVVTSLRVARGLQRNILKAITIARPVIAAKSCVDERKVNHGAEFFRRNPLTTSSPGSSPLCERRCAGLWAVLLGVAPSYRTSVGMRTLQTPTSTTQKVLAA